MKKITTKILKSNCEQTIKKKLSERFTKCPISINYVILLSTTHLIFIRQYRRYEQQTIHIYIDRIPTYILE